MKEKDVCPICLQWDYLCPHHKKGRAQGGSDDPINVEDICFDCHRRIHDKKGDWKSHCTYSFQKEGQTVEDYERENNNDRT